MALPTQDRADLARRWVQEFFVKTNVTAGFSHDDVLTTLGAIDDKLDANVNTLGISGTTPLAQGLVSLFSTTPMAGATNVMKSLIFSYVILKRSGAI